jgi:DNA-3-methyladenine glycosylase II
MVMVVKEPRARFARPLDRTALLRGVRALSKRDPDLASIVLAHGPPPLWSRKPGFATLVHIILEQQVSLASARAAFDRLQIALKRVTPGRFLTLNDQELKTIGFSRQKTGYCRELAGSIMARQFQPRALEQMTDDQAREALLNLKGVGEWSADIYLLMALGRPDIWPSGDLALAVAAHDIKQLQARPSPQELQRLGEAWRPWRAVAARLLWHHYLSKRARRNK